MKPEINSSAQTYSYLALRRAVGWIGILLPFVLLLGSGLLFHGRFALITISQYYYTGMRNVLVGSLCAIGLFLFYYRGYDKWDNWTGNIAGICAVCIAWFPTTETGSPDITGEVHIASATLFFLSLACYSLFLFTRKGPSPTRNKMKRNRVYVICGVAMLVCLLAMLVFFGFFQGRHPDSTFAFWAETTALVAFGISGLTKGGTLYPDENEQINTASLP